MLFFSHNQIFHFCLALLTSYLIERAKRIYPCVFLWWSVFWRLFRYNLQQIYEVPFLRSIRGVVFFRVGQRLGFLSSWPLFTLTHHLVMFYCAYKVYPGQRFTRYAILRDDVCIADENVASLYRQIVNDLGLAIRKGVR